MNLFNKLLLLLLLTAATSVQGQDWPIHYLRTDLIGAWTRGGDLDNDGDPDILVQAGDSILWYENNYPDEWAPHLVDPHFYNSTYGYVELFDLDADGDLDVIQNPIYQKGEDSLSWNEKPGRRSILGKTFHYKIFLLLCLDAVLLWRP
ncbi:MAG: VCBS repeat-containing protein [Saprospirales bacterium]|nr:VCBS repeat-containing protein [Saprospirales bacterium]